MSIFIYQLIWVNFAIAFYIPTQWWKFGKLKWQDDKKPFSFWGVYSWLRKYKGKQKDNGPAFFLSTGPLAFLTDGYHLFQFLSWRCVYGAVAISTPHPWWVFSGMFIGMPLLFWVYQELCTKK